jgi:hypothetical protein
MNSDKLNEDNRLDLIIEAVLYCKRVKKMGMPSSSYSKALREPIYFLWERRKGGNKYDLAEYRSKKSIGVSRGKNLLVRDHSIPFSYIQNMLLELREVNKISVRNILEQNLCACIITREEDRVLSSKGLGKKMPKNWDGKDKMARYKFVNIVFEKNHSY